MKHSASTYFHICFSSHNSLTFSFLTCLTDASFRILGSTMVQLWFNHGLTIYIMHISRIYHAYMTLIPHIYISMWY